MDYEKKYNEALERAKKFYNSEECRVGMTPVDLETIFPELKESEDEKIRKEILDYIDKSTGCERWVAWLEKQGEHANFRNKIQTGDKVTRNEDGALVNLSQLERVAIKKDEPKPDPCEHCKHKRLNCHNFPCIEKMAFEQGKSALEAIKEAWYEWHDDTKELVKLDEPNQSNGLSNQSNGVWHSADETPDVGKEVLVEWKWSDCNQIYHDCHSELNRRDYDGYKLILRWAYIEDLIK